MPTQLDRRRAIVQKLLAVGAVADGLRPNGISEQQLLSWLVRPTTSPYHHQVDRQQLRQELRSMAKDPGSAVESVGTTRYRLRSIYDGKQDRTQLNLEARNERQEDSDGHGDNWWECVFDGD